MTEINGVPIPEGVEVVRDGKTWHLFCVLADGSRRGISVRDGGAPEKIRSLLDWLLRAKATPRAMP